MSAAATEPTAARRSPSLPTFFANLDSFAEAPEGVAKLRAFVLDLAVRGKLVEQDENDEPASELLNRLLDERSRLVKEKGIKRPKALQPLSSDDFAYDLPNGWEWARLGDLVESMTNGIYKPARFYNDDGIVCLRMYNIQDGRIDPVNLKRMELTDEELALYRLEPADLLVNRVNSRELVGKAAIIEDNGDPVIFESKNIRVRFLEKTNFPHYANVFFRTKYVRSVFEGDAKQTCGQASVSQPQIANLVVPVPPLSEQRRIVSKVDGLMSLCDELESRSQQRVRLRERTSLSCLDRLVNAPRDGERMGASPRSEHATSNKAKPAASALPLTETLSSAWQRLSDHFEVLYDTPETLAHLRQSILQLAVQGKLVPQDPNDEPASELLSKVIEENQRLIKEKKIRKAKPLPPVGDDEAPYSLPSGWTWTRPEHLCYQITDGAHHTPTYSPTGIPFLSVKDVSSGVLDFSDTKFISEDQHEELTRRCKPEIEDILLTKVGTTGIAKVVDVDRPFSIFVSLALLKFPRQFLFPRYLELMINSPLVKKQSSDNTQGIGNKNLVLRDIRSFTVPLPPLAEQKRIVAKVDQLLSQCDELSARLRERQSATHGLLAATIHRLLAETRT